MIAIRHVGMVTPLGANVPASCAAIRAGLDAFQDLLFNDRSGKIVVGATVRNLIPHRTGLQLLAEMAAMSIQECLRDEELRNLPLFLATSEEGRGGRPPDLDQEILPQIAEVLGQDVHPYSRTFPSSNTGTFRAIQKAEELFSTTEIQSCLVCGVDSLINAYTLRSLEKGERLKTEDNPDGLIPGEAAGCLYVSPAGQGDDAHHMCVLGIGFAKEDVRIGSDDPVLGLGLSEAIRMALQNAGITFEAIDYRIADVTGERYGFAESNYGLYRVLKMRKVNFEFMQCADAIGSVGAASGVCMLSYLKYLFDVGCSPYRGVMCQTSADTGERAVGIVRGPAEGAKYG